MAYKNDWNTFCAIQHEPNHYNTMHDEKIFSKENMAAFDFSNTTDGGRSLPMIRLQQTADSYKLYLKVPGITPDRLKIEVVNNHLWIHYGVTLHDEDLGEMPYTVALLPLPLHIVREEIHASYENREWLVSVPIDENSKDYRKEIQVDF